MLKCIFSDDEVRAECPKLGHTTYVLFSEKIECYFVDVLLGSTEYSTPIDMWGVGCIFYEMSSGRPLFPGATVEDELHLIFKVQGDQLTWPCCSGNMLNVTCQVYFTVEYTASTFYKVPEKHGHVYCLSGRVAFFLFFLFFLRLIDI